MPISYEILKGERLVVCTASGFIRGDDVLDFHDWIMKDPDFDPTFSQLVDCTAITKTDVTPGRMRVLAERSPFSLEARRAMVAHSALGFGLSRVYEIVRTLRGDKHIHVFRNRADALKWLLAEEDTTEGAA